MNHAIKKKKKNLLQDLHAKSNLNLHQKPELIMARSFPRPSLAITSDLSRQHLVIIGPFISFAISGRFRVFPVDSVRKRCRKSCLHTNRQDRQDWIGKKLCRPLVSLCSLRCSRGGAYYNGHWSAKKRDLLAKLDWWELFYARSLFLLSCPSFILSLSSRLLPPEMIVLVASHTNQWVLEEEDLSGGEHVTHLTQTSTDIFSW